MDGALGRLRLVSGAWLFLFAATHLTNHALGLISLAAAERGREVFLAFWRLPPVEASLALAALVHVGLALRGLWRRRTLPRGRGEILQLGLGLAIPFLLAPHVLATGWLSRCCGVTDSYAYLLGSIWPDAAARQSALTLVVWLHGCVGMHRWLRLKPGYRRHLPWLLVAATLLPALALTGFVSAGRETAAFQRLDPQGWRELAASEAWPDPATKAALLAAPGRWILRGFAAAVLLVLLLRGLRALRQRRFRVRLLYPGGREVSVPCGFTVLEASVLHGIPHASVCGGRGRCSTCRVRVGRGRGLLPEPSPEERRVLARIGAPADVRLACQLRPTATLHVTPLMPAAATAARDALRPMRPAHGVEREVAVLFCDLRGFTRLSEGRLPYDTVYLLNRYFAAIGEAVEAAGGRVDKFIGDGAMAVFGVADPPGRAVPAALGGARAVAGALARLNAELALELAEPLRVAIGLHVGVAILGEMGHGGGRALTAIGDAVNVASRLETAAKELDVELLASDAVARHAPGILDGYPRREIDLRGRAGRVGVRLVAAAGDLPLPAAPGPGGARRATPWWPA